MNRKQRPSAPPRNSRPLRALRLAVLILLLYAVSSMLFADIFFRVIFPRSDGRQPWRYSYAERGAPERTEFFFDSGPNRLCGYRYDAAAPKGLILVVNGLNDDADAHLPEIAVFAENGWSVVSFDATGVGRSEGRGVIGLSQIRLDLLALLGTLAQDERCADLPLLLYGHSAGAYAAASVLDSGYPIAGAVCMAGFDSPLALMYRDAAQTVGPLAALGYPFLCLENAMLFGGEGSVSALDAINAVQTPVLLIDGASDDAVPRSLSLSQTDSCANPNVRRLTVSEPWRSEHDTLWLSAEAAAYVCSLEPGQTPDKALANEPDAVFLAAVLSFFDEAVSG